MNIPGGSNNNNSNNNNSQGSGQNRSGSSQQRSRKFHRGGPPRDHNSQQRPPAPGRGNNSPQHGQQPRPHQQGNRPGHRPQRPPMRYHQQQSGSGGIDQMLMQYDRLLEQHIEARRKYHELYYRCDNNRLNKLEDQFYLTAQRLIRFERELKPWQVEQLRKLRTEIYPLDITYSTLYPEAEKIEPAIATQPVVIQHISQIQQSRPSYKEDKEASEGTMDDYLQYKSNI